MRRLALAALAAIVAGSAITPALADKHRHHDDRYYDERDRDGDRYRRKCGGGNGAVGTIVGGAGGAVIGSEVGGGTLGTVAGGVGGALLGRHLDKKNTKSKRDC